VNRFRYGGGMEIGNLRRAFTLIELLVTIAIIGILAALLLPVLSIAKQHGLTTQCRNNLKQLQTGWELYQADDNDTMPPNLWDGVHGQAAGSARGSWVVGNALDSSPTNIQAGVQWRYNSALGIYHCPADTSLTAGGAILRYRSYSLLNYLGGDPQDTTSMYASRIKEKGSQLKQASNIIAFDCEDAGTINDGILLVAPPPYGQWQDQPGFRHTQGGIFSFADGHVEYWKWKSDPPDEEGDLARVQAGLPEP
jgi:prepilin-type N-terminal cleavage/methylation domain-containing protein/prepilin-type processing-associated H-X9-DG protein